MKVIFSFPEAGPCRTLLCLLLPHLGPLLDWLVAQALFPCPLLGQSSLVFACTLSKVFAWSPSQ